MEEHFNYTKRKLYHLLLDKLGLMDVDRDKFFTILRANHLLIQPKHRYHVTTNSHHRFSTKTP